ncbi:hypothetical protein PUN28_012659 [Cardiocondyla obscurior]|uniref:Uncharacterized protein n=1 Tax=Cardiocondyla obscurior TaxID=286306 RepID=A0AAW2FHY4_9HYME
MFRVVYLVHVTREEARRCRGRLSTRLSKSKLKSRGCTSRTLWPRIGRRCAAHATHRSGAINDFFAR